MLQIAQNFELFFDQLPPLGVLHFPLTDYLDSYLGLGDLVDTFVYFSEATLAQTLPKMELLDNIRPAISCPFYFFKIDPLFYLALLRLTVTRNIHEFIRSFFWQHHLSHLQLMWLGILLPITMSLPCLSWLNYIFGAIFSLDFHFCIKLGDSDKFLFSLRK